ncbi:hypothetical protein GDO81_015142 [Engystomops pustulosus]|uniref:Uncharacterized protein n=1 Tax=Engystomops pustulosus TaxID=76066 RepID=A0AAV7AHG8_ENGPU|nr:hypothetical protein GDO81_015142 [Engystomops pustulosus]
MVLSNTLLTFTLDHYHAISAMSCDSPSSSSLDELSVESVSLGSGSTVGMIDFFLLGFFFLTHICTPPHMSITNIPKATSPRIKGITSFSNKFSSSLNKELVGAPTTRLVDIVVMDSSMVHSARSHEV